MEQWTLAIIIMIVCQKSDSSVVINRYSDNGCDLDPKLVSEIQSYRNVTQLIMDNILNRSGEEMYDKYTKFIDKFGARLSGSKVLEKAIDHMVNLTLINGLDDVKTEEVDVPHWVRGVETASIISPRKKHLYILGLGTSVPTPVEGITAEALIVKSFDELANIKNEDVKGKIVIFNPHFVSYGDTVIYRTQGASKAAKKGAVASLIRSITSFSLYTPHTGAQSYDENVVKIPTASITVEDADLLQRLQDDGDKIIISITMSSTLDIQKSRNTVIDLKGTEMPEKQVIVSGHIDSWDVGQGAMDDGGGMFISWFVPVIVNSLKLKPRRTLRAILWTSEEMGLVGAAEYLNRHENDLDNINFIMESDEGTFSPIGLEVSGSIEAKCIIKEVLKLFKPIDKMVESNYPGSDIILFIQKGVPGASLLNKNERYLWYHHTEADTMDVQNKVDVVNCAAFWAAFSYVIADLSVDIPRC